MMMMMESTTYLCAAKKMPNESQVKVVIIHARTMILFMNKNTTNPPLTFLETGTKS
jgi:hypothetical protein